MEKGLPERLELRKIMRHVLVAGQLVMEQWPGDISLEDFHLKTKYGAVPGSTLDDWPLSYEELEPYYEKAEYELGVSGDPTNDPYVSPRKKPYPMPAFSLNREGIIWKRLQKDLDCILSNTNAEKFSCLITSCRMYSHATCVGFFCPVGAKAGTQNTVIPVALKQEIVSFG